MTWGQAMRASLGATLARPRWWLLALAGFLVRGGIVLLVVPIVVLPTVAGLSIALAPLLGDIVMGGSPGSALAVLVSILAAIALGVILSGLAGTWFDLTLLDDAVAVPGIGANDPGRSQSLSRAFSARLAAHLLTAVAAGFAAVRIVDATYGELVAPTHPGVPLVLRVVIAAPEAVAVLGLAWVLAEASGGASLRRFASAGGGGSISAAIVAGFRTVFRASGLATLVVTDLAVVAAGVPLWIVASLAFDNVRTVVSDGGSAPALGLALVILILAWAAGLWLLGIGLAWRATAWTAESLRHLRPASEGNPIVNAA